MKQVENSEFTSKRKFILRGCQLGGEFALIGSVGLGFLIGVINWVSAYSVMPGLQRQADTSYLLSTIEFVAGLSVAVFLYTFWFGILGGGFMAWIFLRVASRNVVAEKQANRLGILVGAIVGLFMDALPLGLSFITGWWSAIPHGGIYSQVEKNVIQMESLLYMLIWSSVVIAITSIFGGLAGNKLKRDLSVCLQSAGI